MKKWLSMLLVLALCLPLVGCDDGLPKDVFFSDEVLAECDLTGMPSPALSNSRLNEDVLYCNLSQEEYEAFVTQLLAWLRGREEILHLGRYHSFGLVAEIAPYNIYAPLEEDYDPSQVSHDLVFSTTAGEADEEFLENATRITISRKTEKLGITNYTYNTCIRVQTTDRAKLDYCAMEHTYGDGIFYPIPGGETGITVRYCAHCGQKTQDTYLNADERYAITVTEGRKMILRSNFSQGWTLEDCRAGLLLEITTTREAEVTVNGQQIPALRQEGIRWVYGFVMPACDIAIAIVPAAQ